MPPRRSLADIGIEVGKLRHRSQIGPRDRIASRAPSTGVLAAIGFLPVRPGSSFARRFARRPQEAGMTGLVYTLLAHAAGRLGFGIPKYQVGQIDRFGERRILEPPSKPRPQLKPVEPHRRRHERLEKPLALRCVEPRPPLHRRLDQISAPHLATFKSES
jgi:hypothetical protein